ncbi:MAG: glycosyltransferase family 2 protein [Armatimonadetes bacterium]|nr:glycosyltransferase family 2 protein [Armatimonadota bacterium]
MKSWIWGSAALILALTASVVAGVVYRQIDWLHATIVFFTIYGAALLVVPLFPRRKPALKNDCYRPFVSVLIPARNEEDVIEATVRSVCAMQYRKNGKPHFEVLVIDDASSDQTPYILARLEQEFPMLRTVRRYADRKVSGKSAVLNEGLRGATGEIIAVFDADTRVEPNFLVKTVACLYDPQVGGVQGRVRIYNSDHNALTAVQEDEFSVFAHLVQLGKDALNGLTALGGNGQLTRRAALEACGGWNEMSTTEDLDLTLQMLLRGYSVRYCGEAVLWQEAVPTWRALLRQRIRWTEGFIKCFFDYGFPVLFGRIPLFKKWDALFSLLRVLLPLWMLVAYLSIGTSMLAGMSAHSTLPQWLFWAASTAFFAVTWLGIRAMSAPPFFHSVVRVIHYWLYNFIWLLAVPLGFVNCLKHFNTIVWDKTDHRGDRHMVPMASVPHLSYRPAPNPALAAEEV